MAANEAFVDEHHAPGARVVESDEVTAGLYRDLQRLEVPWADVRESRRPSFRSRDAKEMRPRRTAQGHVCGRGRRGNARDRADFAGQQFLKRDFLFRREILGGAVHERNRQRPIRFEASVDRREVSEGLDEQERREHQHQRHCNLRDHEYALKAGPSPIDARAT